MRAWVVELDSVPAEGSGRGGARFGGGGGGGRANSDGGDGGAVVGGDSNAGNFPRVGCWPLPLDIQSGSSLCKYTNLGCKYSKFCKILGWGTTYTKAVGATF